MRQFVKATLLLATAVGSVAAVFPQARASKRTFDPPQEGSYPQDDIPKRPDGAPRDNQPKLPPLEAIPGNVNVSNLAGNEAEVSIAINPIDPMNMVVVGHAPGFATMNTFFSLDGGATWTLVALGAALDGQTGCTARVDPTVAFDANGNVYAGYFTAGCTGAATRTLWLARSSDGGQTYTQITAVAVNAGIDKEIVGTGPDPFSPAQQNVYVAYRLDVSEGGSTDVQIHLAASYDGGATFASDVIINDDSIAGLDFSSFGVPAVGPNGELYVVWDDFSNNPTSSLIMVDVSFDAGATWGTDVPIATTAITRGNANGFAPCLGTRYHIPAQPTRGVLAVPSIAVDRSGGRFDGRVYVAYTVLGGGGVFDTDVVTQFSDTNGAVWSGAVTVNDDGGTNSQFLPWLAVDHGPASRGQVAVGFYDARNDTNNQQVQAFLAASQDGGQTYLANIQVALGQSDQSLANPSAWCQNYLEYIGVDIVDNTACLVWADNSADPTDLDFFSGCVPLTLELPLDIKPGSCPNPFNRVSNGVLPVGLLGSTIFDITEVDVSSVRMSRADGVGGSVAPNEGPPGPHSVFADVGTPFTGTGCDCHTLSGDGILDLSLKFKTQDLVDELLLGGLLPGEEVELLVEGTFLDGTDFTSSDCIQIVPPTRQSNLFATGPKGSWIGLWPPDLLTDGGGFSAFKRAWIGPTLVTLEAAPTFAGEQFFGWWLNGEFKTNSTKIQWLVAGQEVRLEAVYK